MQLRQFLRSGALLPTLVITAAILIIGFGVANWVIKQNQPGRFSGLATAGTYYRLLPDFSCQGRRVPQASIEIDEAAFTSKTINPFDCSVVTLPLATDDDADVALDRKRIGFREGIFERFGKEPNLMETVPKRTELWCRPQLKEAPPIDIFAVGDMDEWTLEIWRGKRGLDQTIEVYEPAVRKVNRTLMGSRLSFKAEGLHIESDLSTNLPGGRLRGRAKLQLDDQLIDTELFCRSTMRSGLICPVGYTEVSPHELFLAQPICLARREFGTVTDRIQAVEKCRKLGAGFELIREEEWLAASKARRTVEWNSTGTKEWTKDGTVDGQPSMPFRCAFHPLQETNETLFPLTYALSSESGEGLPIEVGVRFQSAKQGFVKAIRFYRSVVDPAGYTVHLWNAAGQALGTAATTEPGKVPGWQTVMFAEPVVIEPNQTYTASYYAASGHVSVEGGGLRSARSRGLNLTALAGGGVFITNGGFPTNSGPDTVNYGVDVIFE